jgi:hypothetical protein
MVASRRIVGADDHLRRSALPASRAGLRLLRSFALWRRLSSIALPRYAPSRVRMSLGFFSGAKRLSEVVGR